MKRYSRGPCTALLALALLSPSAAWAGKARDISRGALADYRPFVSKMMEDWKVPGLAFAVVKRGEVVYAEGFGLRDVESKAPVTPDTLFAIGSSTKAFTALLLGTLVDEGKLEWDKPVRTYLPGFQMYDPRTTELVTTRDFLAHRTGLPRHDFFWYNNKTMSRADLMARLRYLQTNVSLRAKWQYNNLMYVAAGALAEQLLGTSWEEGVRARIFTPLGMARSTFSIADLQRDPDHATPYDERKGKVVAIPFRDVTLLGPAGSINSSVKEMAEWVKLQLSDGKAAGKAGGKAIVQAKTLGALHAPAMVMGWGAERRELSAPTYALGWEVDTYRGHLRLQHDGNVDGFSALVTLLPDDELGMVVLTNRNGSGAPEILVRTTMDRLLGLPPIDWSGEAIAERTAEAKEEKAAKEAEATKPAEHKVGTHPAHPLADYAGEYEHPGYGRLTVEVAGDHLVLTYNDIRTPLEHWNYEVWIGTDQGADPALAEAKFNFLGDLKGNVVSVATKLEPQVDPIVFSRRPK